jgi:uncharacterized damage-inducible protein DinB
MAHSDEVQRYLAGATELRSAVGGMSKEELHARPIAGKWSTHEVICHLADFEPIFADRIKRIIATDNPQLPGGDEVAFAKHLAYDARDTHEELALIEACRASLARVLRSVPESAFERQGVHSEAGPMKMLDVLTKANSHLQHHLKFIHEKRKALNV